MATSPSAFPVTGAKYQISTGIYSFWSADGKELFFTSLVQLNLLQGGAALERNIDITLDRKRFVVVIALDQTQSGTTSTPQIQVVENWFEELKVRVKS